MSNNDIPKTIRPVTPGYIDFLKDESGCQGRADTISFSTSYEDIRNALSYLDQIPVTVQGSRTGIKAACVPLKGHILNLSLLNTISDTKCDKGKASVRVQAGVTLEQLENALYRQGLFWPVDPTEKSATIGGIAAKNAAGPGAYFYGPAKDHINSLSIMDKDGNLHMINRDKVDQYIGSEGMLGIIVDIELALLPMPEEIWGVVIFFETNQAALKFAHKCKDLNKTGHNPIDSTVQVVSLEYMDETCLDLISRYLTDRPGEERLARIPKGAAIAIGMHGKRFEDMEPLLSDITDKAAAIGADPSNSWAFSGAGDIKQFESLRHQAMVSALFYSKKSDNETLSDSKPYFALDLEINPGFIQPVLERVTSTLSENALKACVFGSYGRGRFRVTLTDLNPEQYDQAEKWLDFWVTNQSNDYLIYPLYGIGKTSQHILYSPAVKLRKEKIIDQIKLSANTHLLNPGNMNNGK